LHPAVAKERPALASYVSREVAVGIRSEDMEDARLVRDAPADTRLKATVSLVEALGASVSAFVFLVELTFLEGRARLPGIDVISLIEY